MAIVSNVWIVFSQLPGLSEALASVWDSEDEARSEAAHFGEHHGAKTRVECHGVFHGWEP